MQGSFHTPVSRDELRQIVNTVRFGPGYNANPAQLVSAQWTGEDPMNSKARSLDRLYASFVAAHAMVIDMSRAWTVENPSATTVDQKLFTELLFEVVKSVQRREMTELSTDARKLSRIATSVKALQGAMRLAWEEFDNYGVSAQIMGAENIVIQDVRARGLFGAMTHSVDINTDDTGHEELKRLRFVLRRSNGTQTEFARCVGSLVLTQQLVGNNRSSIVEHNRSYNIYENAFEAFFACAKLNEEKITQLIVQNPLNTHLTIDCYKEFDSKLEEFKKQQEQQTQPQPPVDPNGQSVFDPLLDQQVV
jgi:hypothetical protein